MVLVLDGKTDLNQISLTGVRAITLIGLLSIAPRSMEEIRQAFIDLKIMEESHSDDILRVDLNTIKSFGCEISRPNAKTGFKYVLKKHPFNIQIDLEDTKILKRLLDKIKNDAEISILIECDKFLDKLAGYIENEEVKEAFLGVSPLKRYNSEILNELAIACANGYTVKIAYQKPYVPKPVDKDIVAQKLIFQNDKLYLYGYDLGKRESVTLLFKRIKSILSKRITTENFEQNTTNVKFILKDFEANALIDNEKVIKITNGGVLVEGNYFNEFTAIQRILSFGSKCTVLEPSDFKDKIISKLKEMRKLYEKQD